MEDNFTGIWYINHWKVFVIKGGRSLWDSQIHRNLRYQSSVHKNRRTCRTFPMARVKCLMRDFINFNRIYKAHRTIVWWTMKVFRLHCQSLFQNVFENFNFEIPQHWSITNEFDTSSQGFAILSFLNLGLILSVCIGELVQVMPCHLLGAKLSPEPTMTHCKLDAWEHNLLKFESRYNSFHSRKYIWKCCLQNVTNFVTFPEPVCVNSMWSSDDIWWLVNIGSGNGLLPEGTKPLTEPVLTYHQGCSVAFTWKESHKKWTWICSLTYVPRLHL